MEASSKGGLGVGLYLGREEKVVEIGSASALEDGGQRPGLCWGCSGLGEGKLCGEQWWEEPAVARMCPAWCHRLLEVASLLSTLSAPSLGEAGSVDLHLPPAGLSELSFHQHIPSVCSQELLGSVPSPWWSTCQSKGVLKEEEGEGCLRAGDEELLALGGFRAACWSICSLAMAAQSLVLDARSACKPEEISPCTAKTSLFLD